MKTLEFLTFIAVAAVLALLPAATIASGKHDVQLGMDFENAVDTVGDCIQLATGIDKSKIRPESSLEAVGVWDDFSLIALKRYLVHNEDCGVQRYYGVGDVQIGARFYILKEEALAEITRKTTVFELADKVAKSTGRPLLPHDVAARIVSNCRAQALIKIGRIGPFDSIHTSTMVRSDLGPAPARQIVDQFATAFSECLQGDTFGIRSAGVTYPKHGSRSYLLPEASLEYVANIIKSTNEIKYADLVDYVYSNAQDDPPTERSQAQRRALSEFIDVLLVIGNTNVQADSRLFRLKDFLSSGVVTTEFKKQPLRFLNVSTAAFTCGIEELERRRAEDRARSNARRIADKSRLRANPNCRDQKSMTAPALIQDSMTYDQIIATLATKYQ